ncbi:MAG: hypothetical protein IRY94_17480, partial [Rhodospirillaceae bacterium]|nr:hypothetical protein [Rhodospirillaceae bacterium]
MSLSVVFDVLLIALLGATLAYGIRLNRRLGQVRAGQAEFQSLLGKFAVATEQAERGVATLRRAAAEAGQDLQETTERAAALREDLTFMLGKAGELADRLETAIARAKAAAGATPSAAAAAPARLASRIADALGLP